MSRLMVSEYKNASGDVPWSSEAAHGSASSGRSIEVGTTAWVGGAKDSPAEAFKVRKPELLEGRVACSRVFSSESAFFTGKAETHGPASPTEIMHRVNHFQVFAVEADAPWSRIVRIVPRPRESQRKSSRSEGSSIFQDTKFRDKVFNHKRYPKAEIQTFPSQDRTLRSYTVGAPEQS